MKQYIIGVDIGTGSAKAVALDLKGKVIAVAQFYYSSNNPKPGYYEQDPEIIWKAFVQCIKKIIRQKKRLPDAVSFSSAMHSLLVMDSNNKAVTPLITWADTRSEKIAAAIRSSAGAKELYTDTGTPLHSMTPLCKIKWLKENNSKVFLKADKFISIKEFIWFRLFGVYEIDYSIASATGLFNINTFNWHQPSLELCGINASQLSTLVTTSYTRTNIIEPIAAELNMAGGTTFCIGASDGCLANIGSDAVEQGVAALTIGTSGAVRIATGKPVINFGAMIFNYVLDDKTFISGGPVNNGGVVLKWLFQTFLHYKKASPKDYKNLFEVIATIKPGADGLLFLPYINGERAPVWDEKASGSFVGIKSFHTNAHFLRATLEGICFALYNILEIIEQSSMVKQLNVSGGFTHSIIWMQMLADISGKKLCLQQTEDASSIGAALLYMKSIHLIDGYSLITNKKKESINPGKKNNEAYKKYYEVFSTLYKSLESSMHQLYSLNQV